MVFDPGDGERTIYFCPFSQEKVRRRTEHGKMRELVELIEEYRKRG